MIDSLKHEFDQLKIYDGEPYDCNGFIITQPMLGDIIKIGERTFYSMLYCFIGNTTMYRLQLWDIGVDWNKISDYELFCMLIQTINPEISSMLFQDIDFKSFEVKMKQKPAEAGEEPKSEMTLFSTEYGLELSEEIFLELRDYLRCMFNIFPKVEKTKSKSTKEALIEEERDNLEYAKKKNESNKSTLLPMISFCVNHPGYKYTYEESKNMNIFRFMDSVQRLGIYESTSALYSGMYSGMCDLSKVDKNLFNFMREIDYKN